MIFKINELWMHIAASNRHLKTSGLIKQGFISSHKKWSLGRSTLPLAFHSSLLITCSYHHVCCLMGNPLILLPILWSHVPILSRKKKKKQGIMDVSWGQDFSRSLSSLLLLSQCQNSVTNTQASRKARIYRCLAEHSDTMNKKKPCFSFP